jgi:4-aminobutyrate aminotransferase
MQPVKGEGIYLYDADGTKYTDFTSGIGVTNLGHCHPKVVSAIQEQATQLHFGQMNVVMTPQFVELSEKLNDITPDNVNSFFFANSGAEATEAAVKLARHASGKKNIIVFNGSFHGRTTQCKAMTTSKYIYRENYAPLPGNIQVTPFPHSYYYGWDEKTTNDFCMKELNRLVQSQTSPDETAAIFVEPVLGEGGYVPVPNEFMMSLREFCDENNILLVIDEIQSGFGRTGKLFALEHSGVRPDILVMAKGLGNGMPVSAVGASKELMLKWKTGTHGGTYGGGNAVVAKAALATIDAMLEENIPSRAAERGDYLTAKLRDVQDRNPIIGDVRGQGLMVGTEFTDPGTKQPAGDIAKSVRAHCVKNNLLILSCGTQDHVIRWIPPLIVSEEQIDEAVKIFEQAVKDATGYVSSDEELTA